MKERLISLQVAKLAKEKGYKPEREWNPEYVSGYIEDDYYEDGVKFCEFKEEDWSCDGYYLAPTQSILQKWLMNTYKIRVFPIQGSSGDFNYEIYKWNFDNYLGKWQRIGHISSISTFEEAFESGLFSGLNLIS